MTKKEVVAKSYTEAREEVRKFNPFHDSLGRFASSHGFKTYSANPKSRAGALAIQRSNAAGHGRTLNVHRESKGESITQNANWLATGQKPKVPAAVSRQRYQQRKLKQQQAQQQSQAAQKPAAAPKAQAKPKATQHQMAQGKDISSGFQKDPKVKKQAFDQVAAQQGFDKKGRVVDKAEFDAAVKKTGIIAFRTWSDGQDAVSGKQMKAEDFKKMLMEDDSIQAAGNGGRLYGGGTYIAANSSPIPGTVPSKKSTQYAKQDSQNYAWMGKGATAQITLDPGAKIADFTSMQKEFANLTSKQRLAFDYDVGAYAAAKGYDAMRAKNAGVQCDYITVFNRTKMIILND